MNILKLIVRNIFRHKLRAALTVLGIAIAVMAFGLIRTMVGAWYAGAEASAPDRIITRQAVSFIFPLPLADRDQIARVPGVKEVTFLNWFGGVYKDKNSFFARMACDPQSFGDIYPEYKLTPDAAETFKKQRNSCIVGQKLANLYHFKVGDVIPLDGDIYPGRWEFVVAGIYTGEKPTTDESAMYFHWDYLNERVTQTAPTRANMVGWYVIKIANPNEAANVSARVDALFKNSSSETKTETEKAFASGFIAMSSAIITGLQLISYVIIGIIFLVLANTMIMTARERIREYAVLKTLGFTGTHIAMLVFGESLCMAFIGGIIGIALLYPISAGMAKAMVQFFPYLSIAPSTLIIAALFTILVGLVAGFFPAMRSMRIKIVDGLRQIG
jgi:putative ABC transport system permease protein